MRREARTFPVLRSRTCATLGGHSHRGTGLSLCHSFCPPPAGAPPTVRCPPVPCGRPACCKALTSLRRLWEHTGAGPKVTGHSDHSSSARLGSTKAQRAKLFDLKLPGLDASTAFPPTASAQMAWGCCPPLSRELGWGREWTVKGHQ